MLKTHKHDKNMSNQTWIYKMYILHTIMVQEVQKQN